MKRFPSTDPARADVPPSALAGRDGATVEHPAPARPATGGRDPRSPARSTPPAGGSAGAAGPPPPPGGGPALDPPGGAAVTGPVPSGGTTWTIELPPGLKLLSANGREHYMARHRIYQEIKKAAWAMTVKARIPRLGRVEIQGIYDPPDRRHRDADNLAASLKAVIDGIVASGRIGPGVPARPGLGDDSRYVAAVSMTIGEQVYPQGRLRILIHEVTG